MLDDGYPLTTELNALRDIILPPSFADNILSVAGVAGLSKASSKPFSSPIPWRKAGLKYNNNEIYFDVVEELDAIINGLQKWRRDKSLSFVPPDRSFILMEYHFVPVSATGNSQMTGPPFTLKPVIVIRKNGGDISFTLISRLSGKTMSVRVELYLGNGSTGANCTCSAGSNWGYDPSKMVLYWDMGTINPLSTNTLRGTFTSSAEQPRISPAIQAQFEIDQHTYSSLKIDQLKLSGESYKPYKGVRSRSRGMVEFRWNNDVS
ncbi:hypothetical protein Clacol_001598 [Clathrus columnatus]|uniref:MHD domain-containing protein n=1 Tax=Clathrus columnatus TaxID=1419009 RepID=A0AAV4ZYL3_9AGAM|nr:hypothetical protein Clacol_001598 [Clathrus columnatus]